MASRTPTAAPSPINSCPKRRIARSPLPVYLYLEFDLRSQLDHPVRRDLEKLRGGAGVACHQGEQVLAPPRHPGVAGEHQPLASEIVRRIHRRHWYALGGRAAKQLG